MLFKSLFQQTAAAVTSAATKSTNSSISSSFGAKSVTKRHVEHKLLQTHPLHLFRIIQDVDRYSEFLPLCTYSKIVRQTPHGREFDGTLVVGYPPFFSEKYMSRVTVIPEELIVQTQSIQSTHFDSLKSQWKLQEVTPDVSLPEEISTRVEREQSLSLSSSSSSSATTTTTTKQQQQQRQSDVQCLVRFEVEMTVSDPVVVAVLDSVLQQVGSRQVEAFSKRCQAIPVPYDLIELANRWKQQQQQLQQQLLQKEQRI